MTACSHQHHFPFALKKRATLACDLGRPISTVVIAERISFETERTIFQDEGEVFDVNGCGVAKVGFEIFDAASRDFGAL